MRLLLIRHGESKHNIGKFIAGPKGCQGLTDRGVDQARALAQRLRATGEVSDAQVFLTSPVMRTRQTAAALAEIIPLPPLQEDDDLCELLPGQADGLLGVEYEARFGSFDMMAFPDRPYAPGGESWNAFYQRVQLNLQWLVERYEGQTVLAVTHAGYIVISFLSLFDIPRPGTGTYIDLDNTSITEWQYTEGKWKLLRLNEASHLRYAYDNHHRKDQ